VTEQLLEEILVELKGDITELEDELINYENRQTKDPADLLRDPIQLFMRRAHSVKGKLRLANKPTSATVVHELETILDRHLKANAPIERSYVDPLFDALDAVLDNLARPQEDWSRLNKPKTTRRQSPRLPISPEGFRFCEVRERTRKRPQSTEHRKEYPFEHRSTNLRSSSHFRRHRTCLWLLHRASRLRTH
jgi:chemotaxis protein histidine kinase CheA